MILCGKYSPFGHSVTMEFMLSVSLCSLLKLNKSLNSIDIPLCLNISLIGKGTPQDDVKGHETDIRIDGDTLLSIFS